MDKARYVSVEKTPDLPLAAHALAKFHARLVGSEIDRQNRVLLFLEIDGADLSKIIADYDSDGEVVARKFAYEQRRLRGLIRQAFTRQENRGNR